MTRLLEDDARLAVARELGAARGWTCDVRVTDGVTRVFTADPYHPATFKAGPLTEPRVPFTDGTYKTRVDLAVDLRDASGRVMATRSFSGWSSRVVRFPAPHPYRTSDSIHAIGRRHVGCAIYPEETELFRRAARNALGGRGGALAWARTQAGAQARAD